MPRAVILTALPVEYLAVRSHLIDLQEEMHPQGTIYERGKFASNGQVWEVGIVETGAGNAGAAVEAERAIVYFKPDILFFVGVAGGIKDVAIGDVVAATKVYGYESGKVGEQFSTRPAVGQSAYALVQRAKSEARKEEWLQRLTSNLPSPPRVFVAPIAAGEKVVASRESDLFQFLRTSYNDAIAVEMEGFGFLSASFAYPEIKAIVVRGISDLIEKKNDNSTEPEQTRQALASSNASAFAFEILANLPQIDTQIINSEQAMEKSKRSSAPKVFISYSRKDAEIADRIIDALDATGLSVWVDRREIKPGDSFLEKMSQGIGNANYILALFSDAARQSRWVTREWMAGLANESTTLIPVRLETGAIPALLKDIVYFDFVKDLQQGLEEIKSFFQKELGINRSPQNYRSPLIPPPISPLLKVSRRELRLVAKQCVRDIEFMSFLYDADIDEGDIAGNSLNERLINLLHYTKTEGIDSEFADWLYKEKKRCVDNHLKLISEGNS
ncbi:TIR domain-containing protein [Tumidithrix helvetica PCC 7403]|uniref:TIR domain-containing protein n=1 Tax=Tumidithrix helvetica TaxID=3457545 RepID=UPI003CBB50F2